MSNYFKLCLEMNLFNFKPEPKVFKTLLDLSNFKQLTIIQLIIIQLLQ